MLYVDEKQVTFDFLNIEKNCVSKVFVSAESSAKNTKCSRVCHLFAKYFAKLVTLSRKNQGEVPMQRHNML
jgi:hypothetical protein